jgi:AraC family transcriptional regulator, regulatory protein of adaptative response / DNA-3-methyladenine glycosylase II
VLLDPDACWAAVRARDARFDGRFVIAVRTTGIYCRPSCPAGAVLKRANASFLSTAAAAQRAGYRACKRCRPDASPGSPEWDARGDVVARAMRLVADGAVDRVGVAGLARELGYSERHLRRVLVAELGVGPLELARAQRAQTARTLLETTAAPITEVAFAAGFGSLRQFNATIRQVFALTPTELRARARRGRVAADGGALALRLAFRAPLDAAGLLGHLGGRAVPGVEEVDGATYRRSLRLPRAPALVELDVTAQGVDCRLWLGDLRDLAPAVQRCRRLLDLDADPAAVGEHLAGDPALGALVGAQPGLRVPGTVDGAELAVRAVLGQQVSLAAARTAAGRLAAAHGERLARPRGTVTTLFPDAATLAALVPARLAMPAARARALLDLCGALAAGDLRLDPGADREEAVRRLSAIRGVGPWTTGYVAMRALGDPDVFLGEDLGVRVALSRRGLASADAHRRAEAWRPWRSYATQHLWRSLAADDDAPQALAA